MKKILVILIAVGLLIAFSSLAEGVDIGSLSDNELIELFEVLKTEMSERNIGRSGDLGPGEYIVGKDIAEGSYEIDATNAYAVYYIFSSEEMYSAFAELSKPENVETNMLMVSEGEPQALTLSDGNVLVVNGPVRIKESFNTLAP